MSAFLVAGLGLLIKELSGVLFLALLTTLVVHAKLNRMRRVAMASMLFLLPGLFFSALASFACDRLVLVSDAPYVMANHVNHGQIPFRLSPTENRDLLIKDLFSVRIAQFPTVFPEQFQRLWTPNSFPIYRLCKAPKQFGNYGIRDPRPIYLAMAYSYIILVIFSIFGFGLSDRTPFWYFTLFLFIYLSSAGILMLMISRLRLPFMFSPDLFAAWLICHPGELMVSMRSAFRLVTILVGILVFLLITANQWASLGACRLTLYSLVRLGYERFP